MHHGRSPAFVLLLLVLVALMTVVAATVKQPARAEAAVAPAGAGFTVTAGDLAFILKQINIAERHAATRTTASPCATLLDRNNPDGTDADGIPDAEQVPDALTSFGLRTVDGSCNNLIAGREKFAAADQPFPRDTDPLFRAAEGAPPGFFGPSPPNPPAPTSSSYADKNANVFDSQPRVISNLIVDQTSTNPAAIAAAQFPVRSQGNPGICDQLPSPTNPDGVPAGCLPDHQTLFIPNVTTDVGLSPPFNSIFTFFGQFFDHGVDQTVKSGATVFVPLKADDPLIAGPDHVLGPTGCADVPVPTCDDLPSSQRFMVLTRAQNQPGPDGILGNGDDIQNATNTDTPLVDQSQTYTSHSSHQVFLREYNLVAGRPVDTGRLLGDPTRTPGTNGDTGMATWASVKAQARTALGLALRDVDVLNIPMIATDPYGNFLPGSARGLPQYVTATGLVEGNNGANGANAVPPPANVLHFDTPFVGDIAHNAEPTADTDHNPATAPVALRPDDDNVASADFASQPAGTYDDEMLNAHFCAGDGRVNENIALTAVHQIFHSEHDRLVADIRRTLEAAGNPTTGTAAGQAALAEWQRTTGPARWNYGQRLFQAARFVTEMEYQHLVFEEFARKLVPAIRLFHLYHTDLNPVIPAEFAHAVYRFGHSMLDDLVARTNEVPDPANPAGVVKQDNSLPLLTAFLNPPAYFRNGTATYTPEQAAGAIFMGSSDQVGNEIDEFVTETLRNNLLGLPLDLPTINMTRAREAGVPPLNVVRKQLFATTQDSQLKPYTNWSDFGQHLKHPESLINYVAAYGKHPTITGATTLKAKRDAARAIVNPNPAPLLPGDPPQDIPPAGAADFMFSTGPWADVGGKSQTGLDDVDLWVGGLGEVTNVFGGLLGSTFNYVFQHALENLQDGDRFYYLARTPGMNLRAALEANSFSEMVQRNTDGTHTLKADAFATADCRFELGNLFGTATAFTTLGATVADDLNSECDESKVLTRQSDGTIQYQARNTVDPAGINGQGVYNGAAGVFVDRVKGGNDNDTFWGGAGNDIIDGQGGDDVTLGGDGNDSITDLDGADTLKGGPGNDALEAGPGDDLNLAGDGKDFTNGGTNDNETFGGEGDDFVQAGEGADAVFGDGGDDWIEGGSGQDLLIGDHGAPFFDDPAETKPGNEVFVGQVGENDYDAEGGDDLMAQNAAIDRNAGAGGFDWAFHQYDTVGGDDDMMINNNLENNLPVVVNRDRWQETEAVSGSAFNDTIKGTDDAPGALGGAGFTGCDVLDQAGVDRISGLNALLPQPLTGNLAAVVGLSATGSCPLTGPIWGEGNILLGGGGTDTIEGRGADDVIDGDRSLQVRISVRTNPAAPASEIGSADLMEHQYKRDATGSLTGPTLQADVFNGTIDPGNLVVVREIVPAPAGDAGIDTAVFSGPQSNYSITSAAGGKLIVEQTGANVVGQKVSDGRDTLTNVERLRFSDATIPAAAPPAGGGTTPAAIALRAQSSAANATATTLTIPAPAGARAGDVEVMAIATRGAPTIQPPTGWTQVRVDSSSTTMRQAVFTRVVGASEPASYTVGLSSSQAAAGAIMAYSNVASVTSVDVAGGQVNASSTSVTAPSIVTTKPGARLLGFFGISVATTFTPPTGMTERGDVASTAGTFRVTLEGADVSRSAAGATGTQVARAANAGANIGQLVALAPTAGTTTPPATGDTQAPSKPANVRGTATSSSAISVTWTASTDDVGVTGYRVFRDGGTTAVGTVTGTSYNDTGLLASSTHTYTVEAFDASGKTSARSDVSPQVTTQAGTATPPAGITLRGSSFNSNPTANTLSIPAPTGARAGDVEVMAISVRGAPTITPPSGWTLVRTDTNSTTMRQAVYTHVVAASEPASYTWSLSSSQAAAGGIIAYGGVRTVTPVDAAAGQINASSGSVTAPSISPTKAGAQVVGFFGVGSATTLTPPSGMTERGDRASSAGTFKVTLEAADMSRSATGATGTRVAAAAAGAANIGQLVSLAP